jgi:hexosaminidase
VQPVIPTPRRVTQREGAFRLRDGLPVVLTPASGDADLAAAEALVAGIAETTGVRLEIETHARWQDLGPRIELHREADGGEAYRLRVDPDRIELVGAGSAGLRYAVETLVQLADARGRISGCRIDDEPALALRGVMLDISRGKVPRLETLYGIVDLCVRLKLNALMLYVEHTFRFRRHPEIGADASPLDAASLRRLDAYAAARHVELIPSLQSLGHMDHILKLPRYAHLAETPRAWTLSPAVPESYTLLGDLYDEYLPNFRSRWFNANCDESFDLGLGRAAEQLRERGPGGPFLDHVHRLRELAGAHGKRTLLWADMVHAHPERIPEFARDFVFLDWWYEADHDYERVRVFAEHGLGFVVCPGTSSWNCLFPRVANSLENIRRYAEAGRRHGALGLLVTDWGDFGHYNLQGNSWLGYAFAAEQAWGGAGEPAAFDRAFSARVFGDRSGRIARLYRELGAVHDAGFRVFNGSPLQFLFFDGLEEGFFVEAARPAALRRSLARLATLRRRIDAARACFRRERQSFDELAYAADASRFAAEKALAGAEYIAWRRRPGHLDAGGRRHLALRLTHLAREQGALATRLRRLWLARSALSDFELTRGRIARSAASLRRAARALDRNRPPPPPPAHPGFDVGSVMRAVYRTLAG